MQDRYAEFHTPAEPPGQTRDGSAGLGEIFSVLCDFLVNDILTPRVSFNSAKSKDIIIPKIGRFTCT